MKKKYLFGAMAFGLLSAGCSSDELVVPGGDSVSEVDQTLYVSMSIVGDSPTGSRAAGDNGTPDENIDFGPAGENNENAVNNAYFVFYDAAGNVVGDIVPVELDNTHLDETVTGGTIERCYKSVVPVSVKKGENMPTQVICYINPISPATLQNPLSVIQTISRTSTFTTIGGGNTKYFAMSNSVYYPRPAGQTSGLPADNAEPTIAVPIPANYLYTTEAAAEAALGTDNTLNIYVERYATKLSFTAADPTDYVTGTRVYQENSTTADVKKVTLKFVPQKWAVNAESNRTYVIKSFREESEDGNILPNNFTFSALNKNINTNDYNTDKNQWNYGENVVELNGNNRWDWNAPDLHRSYWGMSPSYFTAEYPEVSSDLKDITVNQKYISYNELQAGTYGFDANVTTPQYFKETTVSRRALNSKNPNAAVASVIYVGEYVLSLDDVALPEGTSFYTYLKGNVPDAGVTEDRPYIYFDAAAGAQSAVDGGESMLRRFLAQSTILYRKSETDDEKAAGEYTRLTIARPQDLQLMLNALRVSEISDAVKQAYDGNNGTVLKLQNNARSLQFSSAADASGIYIVTDGGYNEIVADNVTPGENQVNITKANVSLMRQVGLSYYYTSGHAYFSIPVKHFGWYRNGNTQKNADKIDWNIVRVGDFGMVRNHSYQLNVTEILGLASGIGDDDNPIVPPSSTEDYFMAYSVNILKWAIVPQQNVKL